MTGTLSAFLVGLMLGAPPQARASGDGAELKAFQARVAEYVEVHRRLEGPLPALVVTADTSDVRRRMDALRASISGDRPPRQGGLITSATEAELRAIIARALTVEDLLDLAAELEEHTPEDMPAPAVNQALPRNAPFVMIAPQLLRALPPLPPELRYMALSGALVIWDSHPDLVVEVVPRLFDPVTYRTAQKRDN